MVAELKAAGCGTPRLSLAVGDQRVDEGQSSEENRTDAAHKEGHLVVNLVACGFEQPRAEKKPNSLWRTVHRRYSRFYYL